MFEFDETFLKDQIKRQDFSFFMRFYDYKDEIEDFISELESTTDPLQIRKNVFDLSYYYKNIDTVLQNLQIVKKDIQKSKLKKSIPAIVVGGASLFINPFLPFIIIGAQGLFSHAKYNQAFANIAELTKFFSAFSEKITKYSKDVSSYDTRFENQAEVTFSYSETIALISSTNKENHATYLARLKNIFAQNKSDRWQLYLELKSFRESIYEESEEHIPDYDFLINNLIEYIMAVPEINTRLIQETLYYIDALPCEFKEAQFLKLASVIIEKLKTDFWLAKEASPTIKASDYLKSQLAKIPYMDLHLQSVLDELLKTNEKYQAYKWKNISLNDKIVHGLIMYIEEKPNLNRNLTPPK